MKTYTSKAPVEIPGWYSTQDSNKKSNKRISLDLATITLHEKTLEPSSSSQNDLQDTETLSVDKCAQHTGTGEGECDDAACSCDLERVAEHLTIITLMDEVLAEAKLSHPEKMKKITQLMEDIAVQIERIKSIAGGTESPIFKEIKAHPILNLTARQKAPWLKGFESNINMLLA